MVRGWLPLLAGLAACTNSCPTEDANESIDLTHCAPPEKDYTVESSATTAGEDVYPLINSSAP